VDGVSGFFSNRDQMYQMATMPAKAVAATPYTIEFSLRCEIVPQELVGANGTLVHKRSPVLPFYAKNAQIPRPGRAPHCHRRERGHLQTAQALALQV
jgi:hypothetical protein